MKAFQILISNFNVEWVIQIFFQLNDEINLALEYSKMLRNEERKIDRQKELATLNFSHSKWNYDKQLAEVIFSLIHWNIQMSIDFFENRGEVLQLKLYYHYGRMATNEKQCVLISLVCANPNSEEIPFLKIPSIQCWCCCCCCYCIHIETILRFGCPAKFRLPFYLSFFLCKLHYFQALTHHVQFSCSCSVFTFLFRFYDAYLYLCSNALRISKDCKKERSRASKCGDAVSDDDVYDIDYDAMDVSHLLFRK